MFSSVREMKEGIKEELGIAPCWLRLGRGQPSTKCDLRLDSLARKNIIQVVGSTWMGSLGEENIEVL